MNIFFFTSEGGSKSTQRITKKIKEHVRLHYHELRKISSDSNVNMNIKNINWIIHIPNKQISWQKIRQQIDSASCQISM